MNAIRALLEQSPASVNEVRVTVHCAGVDNRLFDRGFTPLMFAVEKGHVDAVRLLLEKGASVAVVDRNGRTPLHVATGSGEPGELEIVMLLLAKGAFIEAKDAEGMTPLITADLRQTIHISKGEQDVKLVRYLVQIYDFSKT